MAGFREALRRGKARAQKKAAEARSRRVGTLGAAAGEKIGEIAGDPLFAIGKATKKTVTVVGRGAIAGSRALGKAVTSKQFQDFSKRAESQIVGPKQKKRKKRDFDPFRL